MCAPYPRIAHQIPATELDWTRANRTNKTFYYSHLELSHHNEPSEMSY